APRLVDYLGETSQAHYTGFKALLDGLGIAYVENHRLVRGLDYYNQTVFEWTTDKLGAQATVCGGGRYDGLIEELGGKSAPSIGFAMGVERLLLLVSEYGSLTVESAPDVYIMQQGEGSVLAAMKAAQALRSAGFDVLQYNGGQSLKAQMKKADGSGARFALIIAESEVSDGTVTLKDLRGSQGQQTVAAGEAAALLTEWKA
ncbi:MAG: His/Gly/Thr/Pro-type tRNA ligase C-terminal domain-containing protein, partial [Neisseria sp.]|nr:His/Gly/Thr/Pro-type tRNA ligase C-terminal domain-containing protein [Neisseria sp.]